MKVCAVTGGAMGIGKEIVKTFAGAGYRVVFIDKDEAAARKTEEELQAENRNVSAMVGDIGDEAAVKAFADYVIKECGSVNALINNACISRRGLLSGCSAEDFNYVLRVGVTAPYLLTLYLKEHFAKQAAIVNISSTRAFMSQQDTESYTAAKGGITALTHALAVSLSGKCGLIPSLRAGLIHGNPMDCRSRFTQRRTGSSIPPAEWGTRPILPGQPSFCAMRGIPLSTGKISILTEE